MKIEKEEVAPPLAPSMTKIVSQFLPSHKIGFAETEAAWIAGMDYCFTTTATTSPQRKETLIVLVRTFDGEREG